MQFRKLKISITFNYFQIEFKIKFSNYQIKILLYIYIFGVKKRNSTLYIIIIIKTFINVQLYIFFFTII